MKIALIQQNAIIGDPDYNIKQSVEAVTRALHQEAELIIFPELSLLGYPPEDLLGYSSLIERQFSALKQLLPLSQKAMIIVGGIEHNKTGKGKPYFNSALVLYQGRIQNSVHKTLLPTYDVFNEDRYFEPATHRKCIHFKGFCIALTICEDIWDIVSDGRYSVSPLQELAAENPDFFINITASPYTFNKHIQRHNLVAAQCKKYNLSGIYVNQVGAQTELLFDGNSFVMDPKGDLVWQGPAFTDCVALMEVQKGQAPKPLQAEDSDLYDPSNHTGLEALHKALICGIRDYFSKNGFKQAVVGSSGGIDSALTLTLACQALGPKNVHALIMPTDFSSDHSVTDAIELSQNLGNPYQVVPIHSAFEHFCNLLEGVYGPTPFDVTEENLQSRIRGLILMAYSNKKGNLLLNTSNKSEMAVGYGTLYGDMAGALSVIGDLYKKQVYALSYFLNLDQELIPVSILHKEPSAELKPNQKDSDSLPDYEMLDAILSMHIDHNKSASEMIEQGMDPHVVERILKLVRISEYKRYQAPPILKVSDRTFGKGRIIPLTHKL